MGENLEENKKGIVSSVLKKEKTTAVIAKLNFFDMPNQFQKNNEVTFIDSFSLLLRKINYFPLDKIESWTYGGRLFLRLKIKYFTKNKHFHWRKKIKFQIQKKNFSVLRENGTTYFYEINSKGVFRKGKVSKNKEINFEDSDCDSI